MSNRELIKAIAKDLNSKSVTMASIKLRQQQERNKKKPKLP